MTIETFPPVRRNGKPTVLHAKRSVRKIPCSRHGQLLQPFAALLVSLICFFTTGPADGAEINPARFVMPNGLTVLVLEQHALPIVQFHVVLKVGSAQDPPAKAGLANIVATLLDEGTTTRTAKQIAEQIDFVGGNLRSSATADFTTVSVRMLQKDRELGIELLADVLLRPSFPEEEFARVRSQLLGEIQGEDENPGLVAAKAFDSLVFGRHPYAWPVNGTHESLSNITRRDAHDLFSRHYLPNQAILVIVGDINAHEARALVLKYFGNWQQRKLSARAHPRPRPLSQPLTKLIDRELTQSTILLGHVGISRTNPDYYAVSVMNYILGAGGFSSRLMDSIRDRQGLAYGVYSSFDANLMPGSFVVSLQTRSDTTNQAITAVLAEINAIRDEEVSDEELDDAKAYLVGSFPLRLDSVSKLAQVLGLVELYGLGLEYFTDYPTLINEVTKADVLRVAKQYLHPERYVLVVVGDQAKAKVGQAGGGNGR